MARWEPDAAGRLTEAALSLFEERGFDATTVADIAARAGLTKRTFFRHFADKREVLFSGSEVLVTGFAEAIEHAPASAGPLDAIGAGLDFVAAVLEPRRAFAPRRQAILDATPELQERERTKLASLSAAAHDALVRRGVTDAGASLAADAGVSVLRVAYARWVTDDDGADLTSLMHEVLTELRAVTSSP